MSAEIDVRNAITILGRGAVLIGHVRTGAARIGQVTVPLVLGHQAARRLEVSAVERLSSMQASGTAVGLVFRDPPHLGDLKRALPAGSILVLEEPGKHGAGLSLPAKPPVQK
jgi:translation elongation factor EF-Tu-like GTPase